MIDSPDSHAAYDLVEFNNMITPYTNRLFEAVSATGVRLAVVSCTRQEPNRSWAKDLAPRFRHIVLPGRSFLVGPRRYAHLNRRIFATLSALRPAILVVTGLYPSMLVATAWAKFTGTALAYRADGGARDAPMTVLHKVARRWVLRSCRAVITSSNDGATFYAQLGLPSEAIFKVPLVPAWQPPTRSNAIGERDYDMLWVAELNDAVKNISFFVSVCTALKASLPRFRALIIGTGDDEQVTLASLQAAGIDFDHRPRVTWDEMADVYGAARLLLLPSRHEPWGLVCNEAMQCGTPCIVSPFVGAAGDLVIEGQNGRVLPLDEGMWVGAASRLLTDDAEWTRLSVASEIDARARTLQRSVDQLRRMIAFVEASRANA